MTVSMVFASITPLLMPLLVYTYDKISSAIENKEHTVGIFIDLFKAFDTVDHNI